MIRFAILVLAMLAAGAKAGNGSGDRQTEPASPAALAAGSAGEYAWWEAENAVSSNFPSETAHSALGSMRDRLSAGSWLTNAGKRYGPEVFARYRVNAPVDGEYYLWCRKRPGLGGFRWRFDEMEWAVCPEDAAHTNLVSVGASVDVGWTYLGKVMLAAGDRDFEMRLLAAEGEGLLSGYDCFVLTRDLFFPRATLRPGETLGRAEAGRFPWEPAPDGFTSGALLDLRSLNERFAGEHGFIRREGRDLVRGDGVPIRFWGVVAGADAIRLDRPSVDYLVRSLAKRGVNAIRCRFPVWGEKSSDVNPRRLDELFYFFAALKREGIYSMLGFYDPGWLSFRPGFGPVGIEELEIKHPFSLIFFEPGMQDLWRTWATAALRTVNPYTGRTLADDPALALVEIAGNDSLFSANFNRKSVPAACWSRLEKVYGGWLAGQYGSAARVRQAWMEAREPDDDPDNGRFAVYEDWRMTREGLKSAGPGMRHRLNDQVRFLSGIQGSFFEQAAEYLRRDMGVRCLIRAGDAAVSDPDLLAALDRATRMQPGVTGDRGSFSGVATEEIPEEGEDVRAGTGFKNLSALAVPESLPLGAVQAERYPALLADVYWANPNQYRADYAMLAAACGGAQGVDGIFTSVVMTSSWEPRMTRRGLQSPVILGSFPAFALAYRRGDISEATDAVSRVLDLERLYALKGTGVPGQPGNVPSASAALGIDPLAYAAMRVVCSYSDTGAPVRADPAPAVDRNLKVIRNAAGELVWDYGRRIVRLDAERIKAVAGFLSQLEKIRLGPVEIESENDYAAIAVVSLDGQPLEYSRAILIQAITTERPYGFRASAGSEGRISDPGDWPFGVERIRARVSLQLEPVANEVRLAQPGRPTVATVAPGAESPIEVVALDANGYPRAEKVPTVGGKSAEPLVIRLLEDSVYHLVRR